MCKNQKLPWVSIDNSQAEGKYEVSIQVAEDVFVSYFITEHNLAWLGKDIALIEKLKSETQTSKSNKTKGESP